MKIRRVGYERTFNLGNFESEHISLPEVEIEVGETVDEVMRKLKAEVLRQHEELKTLEPPEKAIPVTRSPDKQIPYDFDPQEFMDYPNWKNKRLNPGENPPKWSKGSIEWGWEFIEDQDGNLNFSEAALKVLPVKIGDDYEITKTDRIVQTKRLKR